jgi:hypothetical protein
MLRKAGKRRLTLLVTAIAALAIAGSALAFQALPPGSQVNDDASAGINKNLSVSGEDPSNADVVGGALTAGKPAVPWSIFRQEESAGVHDQVFSRSFAGGAWTTRGTGTVGGRSSASPKFSGSLNFDQERDGEAPAIDFAGAGRTAPWATWYENTIGTAFDHDNVFASRFDNNEDANKGKWIFGGQARGTGGGTVQVPSLNIHTNQDAENPSVAGGSAVDPTKPGPWVTWQETTELPVEGKHQIFVSRPIGPGAANCDGVTPKGVEVEGHIPAIGGFCFQQTGIGRVGPGAADPSLNVDTSRDGVEPDIAFTGASDGVPWVVWYEEGEGAPGLSDNKMVFAAKGVKDEAAEGGFHWEAVGNRRHALLDSAKNGFGECAASAGNEEECSLNKDPKADAEDPRVAAGTMNPANPTSPWVAWDEEVAGVHQVFVSRFVATPSPHFEIVNGGAPISTGTHSSTRPDITFSGNTPYVSWKEDVGGGVEQGFNGHFVNAASPKFVPDESDVPLTPTSQANVREPISSSCIATPFNSDGKACQGGTLGTPFFLFTNGSSPPSLFADAYQPATPVTEAASGVGTSSATVSGTVNPQGAAVNVSFQFGTTTAYGQTTAATSTGVKNAATPFTASLTGLASGTTIHYRAVAVSDFGTFVGADETLTTSKPTPPGGGTPGGGIPAGRGTVGRVTVSGAKVAVGVSCSGVAEATCRLTVELTVIEKLQGHKLVGVAARVTRRTVVLGKATVLLKAGHATVVHVALTSTGKRLLARHHPLKAKLLVLQAAGGHSTVLTNKVVTLKVAKKH